MQGPRGYIRRDPSPREVAVARALPPIALVPQLGRNCAWVDIPPRTRQDGPRMTVSAEQARRLGKSLTRAASAPPRRRVGAFLALFLAGLSSATVSTGLSLGAGAVSPPREENQMKTSAMMAVAAVSLGVSQLASGQAVQWRVEDGGNGHWYRFEPQHVNWSAARSAAVLQGGGEGRIPRDHPLHKRESPHLHAGRASIHLAKR